MMKILNSKTPVPDHISGPAYQPDRHGIGIVHFGCGAFHRAHQAVYTDDVLARYGGDWRIMGVSLQSTRTADALSAQNGLYTLVVRHQSDMPDRRPDRGAEMRLVGAIASVVPAVRDKQSIFAALSDPNIHIVSMTVTEKAYGIDRQSGKIISDDATIQWDLANPDDPSGILGFLVKGLALRWRNGDGPFTVLCCDNLPQNGDLVRSGVIDFASQTDNKLAQWIAQNVAFPNTMVDRITPAASDELISEVHQALGARDEMAIETEPFSQWVIEDNFCSKRPPWDQVGAIFVKDVAPYEHMKLRMLNGAHSLLAYMGFLNNCTYVRDVMADRNLSQLVRAHMSAARKTLAPLAGIDLQHYQDALIARFENKNIAHETYQIAMDGTQKLPQRIFAPACDALKAGQDLDCFALATAAWMHYCEGEKDGQPYALRDPREDDIKAVLRGARHDETSLFNQLNQLDQFVPVQLRNHPKWAKCVVKYLTLVRRRQIDEIVRLIARA